MAEIKKRSIQFANTNLATAVYPERHSKMEDVAKALELAPPKAVILSLGGADNIDEKLLPRLTQLYSRGIARAAVEAKATLVSGGTQAGVMALLGEGVAARGSVAALIGVVPESKASFPGSEGTGSTPLEPNHTHFLLTEGEEWGSETPTLFRLVNYLQGRGEKEASSLSGDGKAPVVAILAGGGSVSKDEVLRCVRQNIALIVVEGSGGLADEITTAFNEKDKPIDDPVMAEIVAEGDLNFHPLTASVKGIERLIVRALGSDKILQQAWETFALYDYNANIHQRRFDRIQQAIIYLGVVGTTLVVIQQVFAPRVGRSGADSGNFGWWAVYHSLILIPIILTVLVTAASRFRQGNKWLLLRSGAEAIKREIYRYRTRATRYTKDAEQQLAKRVEQITRRTMMTEVNLSALTPYNKERNVSLHLTSLLSSDDGFTNLTPDRYVDVRLEDQRAYFQRKTVHYEKQLRVLWWLTFLIGGAGSFLAAIGLQAWVALTTALVAAFGTFLGYRQVENTLMKYNQTATDLANVKAWWEALSSEEQANQGNIDSLVDHTEQILRSELDGWVQQMQNTLSELRKAQEEQPVRDDGKETQREVQQETLVAQTEEVSVTRTASVVQVQRTVEAEKTPAETEPEPEAVPVVEGEEPAEAEKAIKPIGEFG